MTTIINASTTGTGGLVQTADASGILAFQTAGTTAVTIDGSQNVGIGTTSPGAKLDVSGNMLFSAVNPFLRFNAGGPQVYVTTGNTLQFSMNGGTSEAMRIDSSGRVGIGIQAPVAPLHVGTLIGTGSLNGYTKFAVEATDYAVVTLKSPAANFSQIIFTDPTNTLLGQIAYFNSSQSTPNAMAFTTNGSERMRIDSSGNLLLGTTSAATAPTGYVSAANTFGFKNHIINGAMVIDQRNAGASVTPNSSYTLDRWGSITSQTSKFTVQQNAASVTPPTGFANYLGVTSSSAYSIAAGDYFSIYQPIEGFNTSDLAFGTASAATVTLSFWVRSSLTGTFGGALKNGASNRSYPFTYTISSANTWEQKIITIAGDISGTWVGATNGVGIYVQFGLGVGSTFSGTAGSWQGGNLVSATGATSVVGTNGATFYITGVQLEKGSTATSFDYRPYGTELGLCYRYCIAYGGNSTVEDLQGLGNCNNSTTATFLTPFPVRMRAIPSLTTSAVGNFAVLDTLYTNYTVTGFSLDRCSSQIGSMAATINTAARQGTVRLVANGTTSALVVFSAEL